MRPEMLYALTGVALFGIGLVGALLLAHLLRRILALNVMGTGVFMTLVALGRPGLPGAASQVAAPDPVPHALVLTGLVVAVSATALALTLLGRLHQSTGKASLPEDE